VSAYLYLPKTASRPFQVVHYVPSDAVRFGLRLPDEIEALLTPLITNGRALFSVVTEGTTERPYPGSYQQPAIESVKYRDEIVTRAIDLQRGLDYLATRPEVDMNRLVGFGASIWSNELIGFGIEQRYRGVVFLASGVPSFESRALPEANAMHFVPRIRTPVLMMNGRFDESMSWDDEVEPLFRLLPEPKQLQAFDGGHMPPLKEWLPLVTGWLDTTLGPLASGHSSSSREGRE
jgi:pimeloyl-ACP methyl ester carboxylesterase